MPPMISCTIGILTVFFQLVSGHATAFIRKQNQLLNLELKLTTNVNTKGIYGLENAWTLQ